MIDITTISNVKTFYEWTPTLSLDLQGSWWRRFWRLGGKNRAETRYRGLIVAEIEPLIEEVLSDFFDPAVDNTRKIVTDFFGDQARFVDAIVDTAHGSSDGNTSKKSKSKKADAA